MLLGVRVEQASGHVVELDIDDRLTRGRVLGESGVATPELSKSGSRSRMASGSGPSLTDPWSSGGTGMNWTAPVAPRPAASSVTPASSSGPGLSCTADRPVAASALASPAIAMEPSRTSSVSAAVSSVAADVPAGAR